jgi:uncharacterized membrane protein
MNETATDDIAPQLPTIRRPELSDLKAALASGWADFRAVPVFGLTIGGIYTFGGLLILYIANYLGYAFLGFPIMAGFALIGPFAAIAIYEVSRLREQGEPVTWQGMAKGLTPNVMRECSYLGILLIFLMAIWLKSGAVVYAMFFGLHLLSLSAFSEALFTTGAGIGFLIVGHLFGAGFAILVFSLSVVSFPLMVDRGTDFITALITSIQTVKSNPVLMIGWGAFIGLALLAGFLTFFVGLMIVLPLLGHASWHLYRRIVV